MRPAPFLLLPLALLLAPAALAGEEKDPGTRTLRLSLREAVDLALKNNLDLRAAGYGPRIAEAGVNEANALYDHLFTARVSGGSSKIPMGSTMSGTAGELSEDRLSAGAGISRLLPSGGTLSLDATTDRTLTNSAFAFVNPSWDAGLGLNLRQPLLRFAGKEYTESGIRLAQDEKDRADLELRAAAEDLVRRVETLYWDLVRARGDAEAERKGLAVAEDLRRVNQARLDNEVGTKVEVSQAAAAVAARQVDVLRTENEARSLEEDLLGLLVPRSPEVPTGANLRLEPAQDPAADLPPLPEDPVEAAVETALLRRSDLRAQRVAADEAAVALLRAESESLVRLDLAASLGYGGVDGTLGQAWGSDLASRSHASWTVGLVLEIPLGNRAARARVEKARLEQGRTEARLRALESAAAVAVRNARRDVASAREQIDASTRAVALSVEQLDAERARLDNGKSTTFEVLRLERDLTDARRELTRSLTSYRSALTRADFEGGRILEARGLRKEP